MDAIDTIKILGSLLGSGGLSKGSGGSVLGNLLGSALSSNANQQTQGGGMLGNVLGSLLGGGSNTQQTQSGGLGSVLGNLLGGGSNSNAQSGGLGDILGSLVGGGSNTQQTQSGGLGSVLGNLLGGASSSSSSAPSAGGLGGLLGSALAKYAQTQNSEVPNPTADNHEHLPVGIDPKEATKSADILIRAMINAAKADGNIDQEEQNKIISKLGGITSEEQNYIKGLLSEPLDVKAFANSVPRGMEEQVYAVSLTAIDLDTNKEARYLLELAQELRIDAKTANNIHKELGAPVIFS